MPHDPSFSQILAAADLADGFIAEILDADPGLLVGKVADQDNKDIAKAARKLAEFRKHLIDALARQPLGGAEDEQDEEDDVEGEDEEEDGNEDDEEDVEDVVTDVKPIQASGKAKRA